VGRGIRALGGLLVVGALSAPAFAGDVAVCGNGAVEAEEQCDDGNTLNWDGCNENCARRLCVSPAPTGCIMANHGKLSVTERGKDDKRTGKFKLELSGFAEDVALLDFGDPVFGTTRYDLCIYGDERDPNGNLVVARGFQMCGKKQSSCWKKKKEDTYVYSDPEMVWWGIRSITLQAGEAGGGRISYTAAEGKKSEMPLLNSALEGDAYVDIRLMTDDGRCFGAELLDVIVNDRMRFKARGDEIR
jgi:cysteine-rich repeat protein